MGPQFGRLGLLEGILGTRKGTCTVNVLGGISPSQWPILGAHGFSLRLRVHVPQSKCFRVPKAPILGYLDPHGTGK